MLVMLNSIEIRMSLLGALTINERADGGASKSSMSPTTVQSLSRMAKAMQLLGVPRVKVLKLVAGRIRAQPHHRKSCHLK